MLDELPNNLTLGPVGFNSLKTISGMILEESKQELRWPQNLITFDLMSKDPTVGAALGLVDLLINKTGGEFKVRQDAPLKAQRAAEFLNWCKDNMNRQTWREFLNETGVARQFGFAVIEKVYERVEDGPWAGKLKWKNLPLRHPQSISKWEFNDSLDLTGVWQNPAYIGWTGGSLPNGIGEKLIPRNKFMLFRHDPKNGNPEGNSPLKRCYYPWKYKQVVEEYELVGVTKDLGGIPVIGVEVDWLSRASKNPSGPEAAIIAEMKRDAANLHAGKQSYVMKPLAYSDRGDPLFTFDLKGIDGGLLNSHPSRKRLVKTHLIAGNSRKTLDRILLGN